MPLVNPLMLLRKAQEKNIAVAAFNVHNMETLQGVVDGALKERAPVIIQTTPGTLKHAGISVMGAAVKALADINNIPIALHVDHCSSYKTIIQCIQNGYSSVMIDGSHLPYMENVALVKKVVEAAHFGGIAVEGELGRIGGTEDDLSLDERDATFTVPKEAKAFVEDTDIDTLAIAIGTAHGMYKGEPKLDFERLKKIKDLVDIPLVLHGASGVPDDSIRKAIELGICKINIATEVKLPMARAIQDCFNENPQENDPRVYMGKAKEAVEKVVRQKIRLCGCSGLADIL